MLLLVALLCPARGAAARVQQVVQGSATTAPADGRAWAAWADTLAVLHDRYRLTGLEEREFSPDELWAVLGPVIDRPEGPKREGVGHSAQGRPLYLVRYGDGPTKVLLWSQMHGDESTATMALADIFHFLAAAPDHPLARRIAEELTVLAVPMLNPDGAQHFRRRNAQGIDVNRDAVRRATPEARALKRLQERFQPAFGFNLHDQDVRTRVGDSDRLAAIALLAPSFNEAQDDNPARLRAKHLAATIRRAIEPLVGGHITRYEADFYPRAFGDNMQKWGVSTVLVESGGWKNDPEKQYLRRVNFVGLLAAFDAIATGAYETTDLSAYASLPTNGSEVYDLLIQGGTITLPGLPSYRADLAINYNKPLERTGGRIENVGHLAGSLAARDTLDVSGLYIHPQQRSLPEPPPDAPAVWDGMPARLVVRRDSERTSEAVWVIEGGVPYRPQHRGGRGEADGSAETPGTAQQTFDVILQDGTIIDGSGAPRYQADVGISDGFIAEIGDLDDAEAERTYDVSGLFVTPGFISLHSHADTDVLDSARNMLTQGVTTEVLNADGGGPTDVAGQLQRLEQIDLAVNVGAYVGFNAVWEHVIGATDRHPTASEYARMQELVRDAMQAGAWGVSSGLQYVPGFYADTDEVVRVVGAAAPWRTQYTSHIRNEYKRVVQATQEAITIGEQAGLAPMITHIKVVGSKKWGASRRMLDLLREARQRETYAAADVYPYLAGQTSLSVLVPAEAQEGGFDALLERLADPEQRARIRDVVAARVEGKYGGAENVLLPSLGTDLAEVAQKMGERPGEAVLRLFEREQHNVGAIMFYGSEGDLERFLKSPMVAVSCDCGATTERSTHPRYYGSWPKVLGQFVREEGLLTWEAAIRKMTGLPATMLGMVRRGFIAEGMIADLTVFNPKTIIDRATYQTPRQYARGIEYVFVWGRPALSRGEVTGVQAGDVLRHRAPLPTRPMSVDQDVRIAGTGTLAPSKSTAGPEPVTVAFAVEQQRAATHATGYLRLDDPSRGLHLDVRTNELGKLQGTRLWGEGWATFTGTARLEASGEEQPLLVIIDKNAPLDTEEHATVTIRIGELYRVSGSLEVQLSLDPWTLQEGR